MTAQQQRAAGLIGPQSQLEARMETALRQAGLHFQAERWIGPYRADFYFPHQPRLPGGWVVEVDGHWRHRTPRGLAHDARKDRFLKAQGVRVVRFNAHQVEHDPVGCVLALLREAGGLQTVEAPHE